MYVGRKRNRTIPVPNVALPTGKREMEWKTFLRKFYFKKNVKKTERILWHICGARQYTTIMLVSMVRGLGVSSMKKRERKNCVLAGERRQLWLFWLDFFEVLYILRNVYSTVWMYILKNFEKSLTITQVTVEKRERTPYQPPRHEVYYRNSKFFYKQTIYVCDVKHWFS